MTINYIKRTDENKIEDVKIIEKQWKYYLWTDENNLVFWLGCDKITEDNEVYTLECKNKQGKQIKIKVETFELYFFDEKRLLLFNNEQIIDWKKVWKIYVDRELNVVINEEEDWTHFYNGFAVIDDNIVDNDFKIVYTFKELQKKYGVNEDNSVSELWWPIWINLINNEDVPYSYPFFLEKEVWDEEDENIYYYFETKTKDFIKSDEYIITYNEEEFNEIMKEIKSKSK